MGSLAGRWGPGGSDREDGRAGALGLRRLQRAYYTEGCGAGAEGWGCGTGAAAGEKGEVKIEEGAVPGTAFAGSETLRF